MMNRSCVGSGRMLAVIAVCPWVLGGISMGLSGDDGLATAATPLRFEQYDVELGSAERQSVLTGFLLEGAMADLAVVHIDEDNSRRLTIHGFEDGGWRSKVDAVLGAGVLFVDVARIDGRDRLISYQPGQLNWLDLEAAVERPLATVTSMFEPPRPNEIPHVDMTEDVNGDGRDDLVLPDADGFWVLTQISGGGFADPVKIGPPADLSGIYGADGYRYVPWSQSRIYSIDFDRDGRQDLVSWDEDHFDVHRQQEGGLFAPVARSFTSDVAFDSDDLYSLASGDMAGRVLHSLADMNGDGIGDLVVAALAGSRITRKRSTYEVHFGAPGPDGGTAFAKEPDLVFQAKDAIQFRMDRHDFDGDGRTDVMLTSIDREYLKGSLWKTLKGMMGDDIKLNLRFYRQDDGRYSEWPEARRRIALDGVPSHREPGHVPLGIVLRGATHEQRRTQTIWPKAFNSTLRIGDLNGDSHQDLVISSHPRSVLVITGIAGPDLFSPEPQSIQIPVPNDEEYVRLVDLNLDGKQDLLMHYPFILRDGHGARKLPPGTERQRLTMLIVR